MERHVHPLGRPRGERADAARNRRHLLATAREMIEEQGVEKVTMDALAERAGLGKGTVFRRFGTRAGIFQALLDDVERSFQERVMSGPPPLGPGAPAVDRLIAYGEARIAFLIEHRAIARAALGRARPASRVEVPLSRTHIRMLLGRIDLGPDVDLDVLAAQLTSALDGVLLVYTLSSDESSGDSSGESSGDLSGDPSGEEHPDDTRRRLVHGWRYLVRRICRA